MGREINGTNVDQIGFSPDDWYQMLTNSGSMGELDFTI